MGSHGVDRAETELEVVSVELVGGKGKNDALGVELATTDAGALMPRSLRADEAVGPIITAAELRLMIGRYGSEVAEGDLVTPLGEANGQAVVGHTQAVGTGALQLTDQRAIGLVWESTVDVAKLAAQIQEDGSGSVLIFTVVRRLLQDSELKTSFGGGKVKSAKLSGACFVDLHGPLTLQDSNGKFYEEPDKRIVSNALQAFVQG